MPDELHPRHLRRRVVALVVVAVLVVAAVAAVPGLAGIRHRLAHAEPVWLVIAAAAQLAAALSYVALFRDVFSRRTRWGLSLQIVCRNWPRTRFWREAALAGWLWERGHCIAAAYRQVASRAGRWCFFSRPARPTSRW